MNSRLEEEDKEIKALREKLTEEDEQGDTRLPPPLIKSKKDLRFEKLEQLIHLIVGLESRAHGHDMIDPELRQKLPKEVALGDLPNFKGVEDPDDHSRAFFIFMAVNGMRKDMFVYVFPLTLDAHPSKWFKSLNKTKCNDWDYIKEKFHKQYIYIYTTLSFPLAFVSHNKSPSF